MKALGGVAIIDEDAIKVYWREYYVSAFNAIIEDINYRLESPSIQFLGK